MEPQPVQRALCTLESIAEGHADRCSGEACPFWERGCVLARVQSELEGRPDVAQLLLELRHELVAGRDVDVRDARTRFARVLDEEEGAG